MDAAAEVNAAMVSAMAYIRAQAWGSALIELLAASAALVAVPDAQHQAGELEWDHKGISDLIGQVKAEQAKATATAALGMIHTPITYVRPTE